MFKRVIGCWKKRGISPVIATVLLVLLVVAAIAITWAAIRPFVSQGAREVENPCTLADVMLDPQNVCYDSENKTISVGVSKGPSEINITRLQFIFSYEGNDKTNIQEVAFDSNTKKIFYFDMSSPNNEQKPTSISIIPIVRISDSEEKTCDASGSVAVKDCKLTQNIREGPKVRTGWSCDTKEDCLLQTDECNVCTWSKGKSICNYKGMCYSGGGGGGITVPGVPGPGIPGNIVGERYPIDISSGTNKHICILFNNGNTNCIYTYKSSAPASSSSYVFNYSGGDVKQISAGRDQTCILLNNGNVFCSGYIVNKGYQIINYTGGNAIQISGENLDGSYSNIYVCILLNNGNVTCLGGDGFNKNYGGKDAIQVSTGGKNGCILLKSGNIICLGDNTYGQASNYTQGNAVSVSSGYMSHTCALLSNGNVNCWGDNTYGQAENYTKGDAIEVSATQYQTCILLRNGNVTCFGYSKNISYGGKDAVKLSKGDLFANCFLLNNKKIRCLSEHNSFNLDIACANESCGWICRPNCAGKVCGDDGCGGSCGNLNGLCPSGEECSIGQCYKYKECYLESTILNSGFFPRQEFSLSSGAGHTCVLLKNETVQCWGNNNHGQLIIPPSVQGNTIQVSSGNVHTCALLNNGNVVCWGINDHGELNIPPSVQGNAVQVSAGQEGTCALLNNGNITCWGVGVYNYSGGDSIQVSNAIYGSDMGILRSNGKIDYPNSEGNYSGGDAIQVASVYNYLCALLNNGNVTCWGLKNAGESSNYGGGDVVQVVSSGYVFSTNCVLLNNGNVTCWGSNLSGELDIPPSVQGNAIQLTSGYPYLCALLNNGNVTCWGERFGTIPSSVQGNVQLYPTRRDVCIGNSVRQFSCANNSLGFIYTDVACAFGESCLNGKCVLSII